VQDHEDVSSPWARAAFSHRICTGISRGRLGELISWPRRGRQRRSPGCVLAAALSASASRPPALTTSWCSPTGSSPPWSCFQLLHAALAVFYGVDRSTMTRAVQEIRPLLAARGFAVPGHPGLRLHTLADVFAYAAAEGVTLRADGTEVQVRRPRPGRPGRGRSSRASAGRTPRRPPSSPTATAPPCGPGRSGPAASMIRPR
jgi:hypothetical protein